MDKQKEFYQETYARLLFAVQQSYSELEDSADFEGIVFLNNRLSKLGEQALKRVKEKHSDIF